MNETSTNSAFSFKSLSDLMNGNKEKETPGTTELLNGLRSESGWKRLQTVAKIATMIMG